MAVIQAVIHYLFIGLLVSVSCLSVNLSDCLFVCLLAFATLLLSVCLFVPHGFEGLNFELDMSRIRKWKWFLSLCSVHLFSSILTSFSISFSHNLRLCPPSLLLSFPSLSLCPILFISPSLTSFSFLFISLSFFSFPSLSFSTSSPFSFVFVLLWAHFFPLSFHSFIFFPSSIHHFFSVSPLLLSS